MRGPILSGPLGSASALEAILRWVRGVGTVAVIAPLWLGEVLATEVPVLLLTEAEERDRARRLVRRAAAARKRLAVVTAGVELPLGSGEVAALIVDSASALAPEAASRWLAALVPTLRPGGRLIALDATDNPTVEARLAALCLEAALTEIVQERPRDGVLLTVAVAPARSVVEARFFLAP